MSKRRMFSPDIVSSDAFVDMPMSAQALYFHLCLNADDDGFIARPKQICRMVSANDDDLKILFAKRFLLGFDSGVAVVKHWLIHNLIRADLYVETTYKVEKDTIGLNEYGAYTELRDGVERLKKIKEPEWLKKRRGDKKETEKTEVRTANVPQSLHNRHIGKVRLGKVSNKVYTNILTLVDSAGAEIHVSEKDLLLLLCKKLNHSNTIKLTDGRISKMKRRLKVHTPTELVKAAIALGNNQYMQGDNEAGVKYGDIDYLLRNDENIDKYLRQPESDDLSNLKKLQEDYALRV